MASKPAPICTYPTVTLAGSVRLLQRLRQRRLPRLQLPLSRRVRDDSVEERHLRAGGSAPRTTTVVSDRPAHDRVTRRPDEPSLG